MVAKRAVLLAIAILVLLPASALAVAPVNDDYLNATSINSPGTPLDRSFIDSANVAEATTEADLCPSCAATYPEPTSTASCSPPGSFTYGYTVWWDIYPEVAGRLIVTAGGYDAVIGLLPFSPPATPSLGAFVCSDNPSSSFAQETLDRYVTGGQAYSIQVGWISGGGDVAFTTQFVPDRDRDGFYDEHSPRDNCPDQAGSIGGCPDSDGDSVIDRDDRCPQVRGHIQGCPDADGDGISEPPDACPGENSGPRDANKNGCLDYAVLETRIRLRSKGTRRGVRVKVFGMSKLVKGARIQVTCKRPRCRRFSGRARRTSFILRRFGGLRLPAGMRIFIRITANGYVGKYITVKIKRGAVGSVREYCLQPGSNRPRRPSRCNAVR